MKRIASVLFLVLWTVALCVPDAARILAQNTKLVRFEKFPRKQENRRAATRPSFHRSSKRYVPWRELGRGYEAWYNDRFPWRTELLRFHRRVTFERLKIPSGRSVPGRGDWIFRRGGDWPELDDYLGAFELPPEKLDQWVTLFEGRREWAEALGSVYLTMPAPVKAQVRWQMMYPALQRHRGRNVGAQIREALEGSPARDDVLFADEDFERAVASGREVFFDANHHPDAYGQWLLYDRINRRLAERFPGRVGETPPWFDEPPPDVLEGRAPGCWRQRDGDGLRLDVSSPGEIEDDHGVSVNARRFPYCNVATVREGGGLSILMAHDSYMRFTLASWRRKIGSVRFPFAPGVGSVRAHIFQRFTHGFLENAIRDDLPDVFIEQFPECRLNGTVSLFLDPQTSAAAAFGRAVDPAGRAPAAGARVAARAVFDGVRADPGHDSLVAVLLAGDRELAREPFFPGVKRAVFFSPVAIPADVSPGAGLAVRLEDGAADATNFVWRLAAEGR